MKPPITAQAGMICVCVSFDFEVEKRKLQLLFVHILPRGFQLNASSIYFPPTPPASQPILHPGIDKSLI